MNKQVESILESIAAIDKGVAYRLSKVTDKQLLEQTLIALSSGMDIPQRAQQIIADSRKQSMLRKPNTLATKNNRKRVKTTPTRTKKTTTTTTTEDEPVLYRTREEIAKLIDQPLPPGSVKKITSKGIYITGETVIAQANKVFGKFGWNREVQSVEKISNNLALAKIRITIKDETGKVLNVKEDVGTKIMTGRDAAANVYKAAVTDGTKRALKVYGKALGLGLEPDD